MRRLLIGWIICAAYPLAAVIEVQIDNNLIYENESFQLQFISDSAAELNKFPLPNLPKKFEPVSAISGQSIQIINGVQTTSHTRSVVYRATQAGTYPMAHYFKKAQPVGNMTLKVRPGISPNISMQLRLKTKNFRIGAAIPAVLTVELSSHVYTKDRIEISDSPDWEIKVVARLGPTPVHSSNNQTRFVFKYHYLLIPLANGPLKLPVFKLSGRILSAQGSSWMTPRYKPFSSQTRKRTIKVQKIPTNWPKNAHWLPARDVSLEVRWDGASPDNLQINDPISMTLVLRGKDLPSNRLPAPNIPEIDGVRSYREAPQTSSSIHSTTLISEHQQRMVLMAQRGGRIVIPKIRIPWWDTKSGKIRYAEVKPKTLKVLGSATIALPPEPEKPTATPQDASADSTRNSEQLNVDSFLNNKWVWALGILWILTLLTYITFRLLPLRSKRYGANSPNDDQQAMPLNTPAIDADPLRAAYQSMVRWALPQTPAEMLNELQADQLLAQFLTLEAHIYNDQPLPEDLNLKQLVRAVLKLKPPNASRSSDDVPGLYE